MAKEPLTLRPLPAWSRIRNILNLTLAKDRKLIAPLDDRSLIQESLHRYCWGFDERNIEILDEVFDIDAQWEAIVMGESTVGPFVGKAQVLEWLGRFWNYQKDQRRHLITNFIVEEITEDSATALAYLLLSGSSRSKSAVEITGWYRMGYKKRGGVWRIHRLYAGFDAPFWKMDISEMSPELIQLFGITKHIPSEPNYP
jgi:hypothetical protein